MKIKSVHAVVEKCAAGICLCLWMGCSAAYADILGVANGRSADVDSMANVSVEAGITFEGDWSTYAARVNYKVSPEILVFGDLGLTGFDSGFDDESGLVFGFGGFYQFGEFAELGEIAVKASYHTASVDYDSCSFLSIDCSVDLGELAIEALASGEMQNSDLRWYANVGMHFLTIDFSISNFGSLDDDSTEIAIGGGVVGDLDFGEWYAGMDLIDDLFLVAGVRYNLR